MKAIKVFIAAACCSFAASAAHAEACKALSKTASGERQITSLTVELAQSRRLDPRALPDGASAGACPIGGAAAPRRSLRTGRRRPKSRQ